MRLFRDSKGTTVRPAFFVVYWRHPVWSFKRKLGRSFLRVPSVGSSLYAWSLLSIYLKRRYPFTKCFLASKFDGLQCTLLHPRRRIGRTAHGFVFLELRRLKLAIFFYFFFALYLGWVRLKQSQSCSRCHVLPLVIKYFV